MAKKKNDFDFSELRKYYEEYETCRWCGKSGADAFHHVISKKEPHTGSLLNATPLHNYTCHINIHGELMHREQQEKFIRQNVLFLLKKGYKFTDLDKQYIDKHNLLEVLKSL